MLSLAYFGTASAALQYPAGARTLALTPRVSELLAFLALRRGQFFTRPEIADSVWDHAETDATVASVNTALWRLRRAIEPEPAHKGNFLVIDRRGAVSLNGPKPVAVDIAEFEALALSGLSRPIEQLTPGDRTALQSCVALYRDNALAEFTGTWALKQRERIRNVFMEAAGRLIQLCGLEQQYAQAIHYAQLVLEIEELREDVHRDLMRLFVLNGQRALALRQFEACRAALQRELAIQPMPATMTLYRQIVDDAVAPGSRSIPPASATAPSLQKTHPAPRTNDSTAHVRMARSLIAEADQRLQQALDQL